MPRRIDKIDRIIAGVRIKINPAFCADGIGLEEAAEAGGIGAGALEVEPGFLVIAPPGIAVGGGG